MARFPFGATGADLAVTVGAGSQLLVAPTTYLRFWSAATSGTEYTDFLDSTSTVIAAGAFRSKADGSIPMFYGPDTIQVMFVGNGTDTQPERFKILAHQDVVLAALPLGGAGTIPTAEKTTSYTAVAGDFVPVDLTAGAAAIQFPSAPADKTQIGVQVVAVSAGVVGAYTATVTRGGTDTFTRAGGSGSITQTLNQLGHSIIWQYKASTKVWYAVDQSISPANQATINTATYAAASANDAYLAYAIGDTVSAGMPVLTQDLFWPVTRTISDTLISQEFPNLASGTVVYTLVDRNPATPTETVIGTMTLQATGSTATSTANTRAARLVFSGGSSYVMTAGHKLKCYVSATNGSGYWGAAPQLHIRTDGSTFTLPSMPSVPGTVTATPGTSSVTLSTTLASGAEDVFYVDTSTTPPTPVGRTVTGTIVHGNLLPSSSHTYVPYSLSDWAASAAGSGVTSGPGAGTFTHFNAVSGGIDPAKWTATLGSNSGTGVTVDGSNYAILVSGAAGTGNPQDRVHLEYIEQGTTATWSAFRLSQINYYQYASSDVFTYAFSANAFTNLATSYTTMIQFQVNASGVRVGIKTGGSFITLTASGSTQATVTSLDGSGVVPFETTHTTSSAVQYGLCLEALPIAGDGTQVLNVYSGTTTQANDGTTPHGSLVLLTAVTLTSAQRSAIPAGHVSLTQEGAQGTAATETTRIKLTAAALSPVGT